MSGIAEIGTIHPEKRVAFCNDPEWRWSEKPRHPGIEPKNLDLFFSRADGHLIAFERATLIQAKPR